MNVIVSILLWMVYLISLYFAIFWFIVFLEGKKQEKPKKLKKFPSVSVVIPAYNEEKTIRPTIKSVLNLKYPRDKLEIIIINDGSTDKTSEIAEKMIRENKKFNIILINQKNMGKGAALNIGIKKSKNKFFICLDADSSVEKNALIKMLPHFKNKNTAAVLPTLKVKKPKNIIQKMQWYEYLINMFYKELMSRLNSVHVAPGPFSIYRKNILKKVGGFDENNNLTEDLEMTLRLQSHNYEIVQLLDTEVKTVAPDNIRDLYKQRNRWYKGSIINAIRYRKMIFNKKYGDFGLMQMPTIIISGIVALTLILSIIYYSLKPYVVYFYNMSFVDFDFLTFLKSLTLNIHFLDLNYMTLLVAIVMLLITMTIIKKSHVYTKERITKYGVFSLMSYLFFYFLLLGIMWIGISIELIMGKIQKW